MLRRVLSRSRLHTLGAQSFDPRRSTLLMARQQGYSTQGLMSLVIKVHDGNEVKTVAMDVNSNDSVESVKRRLQELHGCGPAAQQILVLGLRLDDSKHLADYGMQDKQELHMRMKPAS